MGIFGSRNCIIDSDILCYLDSSQQPLYFDTWEKLPLEFAGVSFEFLVREMSWAA